jgi:carbamoyl-phosphate synthase large subunit
MRRQITLLMTSCGRRVELMRCFREDAANLGIDLTLGAVDLNPKLSSACLEADWAEEVPRCTGADYIPCLLDVCRRRKVGVVIPTIDTELAPLALHKGEFEDIGVSLVVSEPHVVALAQDKMATATALEKNGLPSPKTANYVGFSPRTEGWQYPLILKPRDGSSSVGIIKVENPDAWPKVGRAENYIVQEMWSGREYTVNMYFKGDGSISAIIPHLRLETRSGEVSKGRTERLVPLIEVGRSFGASLRGARGPLCFQAMVRDSGEVAIFEFNARFGGGYPLAHHAGAHFSRWILEEHLGLPDTARDVWQSGVVMLRYDAAFFVGPDSP